MILTAKAGAALWLLGLGLASPACSRTQDFRPAERATAISPQGYTAADYNFGTRDGAMGDAKVWSNGAKRMKIDGRKVPVIHVGFQVENRAEQPLTIALDDMAVDVATGRGNVIRDLKPTRTEGSATIPPNGDTIFHTYFAVPEKVKVGDLEAFRVRWSLENGDQIYAQRTPFLESPAPHPYPGRYYYSPFYDPFWPGSYAFPPGFAIHQYPYRYWYYYP